MNSIFQMELSLLVFEPIHLQRGLEFKWVIGWFG
jgi:hypothetical protein